jgi:uncharacterized protein
VGLNLVDVLNRAAQEGTESYEFADHHSAVPTVA